jgi:hypothetical protein
VISLLFRQGKNSDMRTQNITLNQSMCNICGCSNYIRRYINLLLNFHEATNILKLAIKIVLYILYLLICYKIFMLTSKMEWKLSYTIGSCYMQIEKIGWCLCLCLTRFCLTNRSLTVLFVFKKYSIILTNIICRFRPTLRDRALLYTVRSRFYI